MRKSTPMANLIENSGRVMPAPITHRNPFPTGSSFAGCTPAETTSASPAHVSLQPEIPFDMAFPANGNRRSTVCLKEGRSALPPQLNNLQELATNPHPQALRAGH